MIVDGSISFFLILSIDKIFSVTFDFAGPIHLGLQKVVLELVEIEMLLRFFGEGFWNHVFTIRRVEFRKIIINNVLGTH